MSETNAAAPEISGKLYLFEKPEIVNKQQHAGFGVTAPERPFGFCENVRIIPLNANELIFAQKSFPIVFSDGDAPLPLAAVGVVDEKNLFVTAEGQWAEDAYIPNYVRKYPFALAADQNSDRMALVVDAGWEGFVKGGERQIYNETGDATGEIGQNAVDSCRQYEEDRQQTVQFGKLVKDLDLLTQQMAQFTPEGGQQQPFAQYWAVDENRLKALPNEKFLELRDNGALPLIYAHLMSIGNWRRLVDRRARRFGLTAENVLKPLAS